MKHRYPPTRARRASGKELAARVAARAERYRQRQRPTPLAWLAQQAGML